MLFTVCSFSLLSHHQHQHTHTISDISDQETEVGVPGCGLTSMTRIVCGCERQDENHCATDFNR